MLLFLKKPVLTATQIERLSNILDNAGQVFLGGAVLAPLVQGIDKTNTLILILGAIYVTVCWSSSMILARDKEI